MTLFQSDVDECLLGLAWCDKNATCVNTEGGFNCKCPDGFTTLDEGQMCNGEFRSTIKCFISHYQSCTS